MQTCIAPVVGFNDKSHTKIAVQMGFFTYLDRNNLAFAAFQFKADLRLSNSVYGLGELRGTVSCSVWHSHIPRMHH